MGTIDATATISTVDLLELRAIGEAIFAEWYPDYREGDPIPEMPPPHIMQEIAELAEKHRALAARRRGWQTA